MRRALVVATALLLVGDAMFLVAISLGAAPSALAYSIWLVPPVASFAAAWLAPRRKFLAGLLVALPAVALIAASNYAFEVMGNTVDFPGLKGALLVMGMSLPLVALLCGLSAAAGHFAFRREANAYMALVRTRREPASLFERCAAARRTTPR